MEEIKNNAEEIKDIVESEEVMEVALADSNESDDSSEATDGMEYTEAEMSGLTDEQRKRKEIWEKVTTGILIALLCSPILILLYLFLWFFNQMMG